ncbi:MAG TPA: hypothetical protein PLF13_02780 [candidate division Zixibacteria bacterium]|nr:hypothetical protein [candidate division Zixibacteria bacterium]
MSTRFLTLVLVTALLFIPFWGCGDDSVSSSNDGGDDSTVGTTVDTAGGVFTFVSGAVGLNFPRNAVDSAIEVAVEVESSYPADDGYVPGSCYDFSPDGQQFLTPITISIKYSESNLPSGVDESSLRLCKIVNNAWSPVAGYSVCTDSNYVSAPVNSFSSYGIVGTVSTGGNVYEGDYAIKDSATLADFQDYTSIDGELEIWTCAPDTVSLPNLLTIDGTLYIRDYPSVEHNIVHVSIPNLSSIDCLLKIEECDSLRMVALPSLESAGSIVIQRNPSLQNVDSLFSLTTLNPSGYSSYGSLYIYDNDSLTSLLGLGGISGAAYGLTIKSNALLTSLVGLEGISSAKSLTISYQSLLTTLVGLNIRSVEEHAIIRNCDGLEDLHGLENLQTVGWSFEIEDCGALTDLTGLSMLSSVGGFFMIDNNSLESLDGLGTLQIVDGSLQIENCDELSDISALEFVTTVGANLYIESCDSLRSLEGLDAVTHVGGNLYLQLLQHLDNVDALAQLDFVEGSLRITNCWRLTSVEGLWGLLPNSATGYVLESVTITDNAMAMIPTGLSNTKAWELVDKIGGEDMVHYTVTIENN